MAAGSLIIKNLFQRTLDGLIKGMHLQLIGKSVFISKAVEEIYCEIKSMDPYTIFTALHNLCYLSALHSLEMSWAAFQVVELMSFSRFSYKAVDYHTAAPSFHDTTPVLLLSTNQLHKDLSSPNPFDASLARHTFSKKIRRLN